jgi:hypothetical protein
MKFAHLCSRLGYTALIAGSVTAMFAQPPDNEPVTAAKPMFVVLPAQKGGPSTSLAAAAPSLSTWNGSFTYNSKNYTYNMVGTAPSANTTTTIPVVIIPLKIVITSRTGGKTTYDPSHVLSNGKTVTSNTVASPIFDSTTTYTQGGVDMGTTQYIDAFQRANFWGAVSSNTNYHLLLGGPTVLAEQTLSPSKSYGKTGSVFGFTAGLVDINWFDTQVNSLIKSLGITANQLPIFLTYNVYLTQRGSCCIGGYHSATGAQAYAHATYVDVVGAFAQNVSALSHEVGEWADDPLVVNANGNNTPCGILEVGDPLENEPNYGAFAYTVNGFTYDLQDLVMLPYFGAPTSTSVNGWFTFQGRSLTVCQNGS